MLLMMTTSLDAADFILARQMSVDTWKLHKLLHYAQGWHLAWYGIPLFDDNMQAWVHGPVAPAVYQETRGNYRARSVSGVSLFMSDREQNTLCEVLRVYGALSGEQLRHLSHMEPAWKAARGETPDGERSNAVISNAVLLEQFRPMAALGPTGRIPLGVELGLRAWLEGSAQESSDEPVEVDVDHVGSWLRGESSSWRAS